MKKIMLFVAVMQFVLGANNGLAQDADQEIVSIHQSLFAGFSFSGFSSPATSTSGSGSGLSGNLAASSSGLGDHSNFGEFSMGETTTYSYKAKLGLTAAQFIAQVREHHKISLDINIRLFGRNIGESVDQQEFSGDKVLLHDLIYNFELSKKNFDQED